MEMQRRFTRWRIDRRVKVKLEGAEAFMDCMVKDISLKGLMVSLVLKLPQDTFLGLSVALSEETVFELEVWVVWHRSVDGHNLYGFYFSKIKDADKEKIYQFIRKFYPQQLAQQWWPDVAAKKEGGEKMEDRRIFQRFRVKYPLRFLEMKSGKEGIASTSDISARGMNITTAEQLTAPMTLEMWLTVPDRGEPLYTRGEVVWSKPLSESEYQVGINLEKAELMALARVLRAI